VAKALKKGQLIILQSTTFPGTTTGPFREALEKSGLTAGVDFDLAFAPERVNPGDPASAARTTPRLVGATTESGTARAAALLGRINDHVVSLPSPDHAELAKLLENTFRNVNIALVNQLRSYGNRCLASIANVRLFILTSIRLIQLSCPANVIGLSGKKRERPTILRDSTVRYVNEYLD
jgi:nucleotide sugar dehydrogenase